VSPTLRSEQVFCINIRNKSLLKTHLTMSVFHTRFVNSGDYNLNVISNTMHWRGTCKLRTYVICKVYILFECVLLHIVDHIRTAHTVRLICGHPENSGSVGSWNDSSLIPARFLRSLTGSCTFTKAMFQSEQEPERQTSWMSRTLCRIGCRRKGGDG
jgi:hypothetical protein